MTQEFLLSVTPVEGDKYLLRTEHERMSAGVPVAQEIVTWPVEDWIEQALAKPELNLVQLSTQIILDSTRLPQPFHRDPADQLLVATARVLNCPLMTVDTKIVSYVHVRTL